MATEKITGGFGPDVRAGTETEPEPPLENPEDIRRKSWLDKYERSIQLLIEILSRQREPDPRSRALSIIHSLDAAWWTADRGYRYRAGEREHPEWTSFEDEYRTSIRRREAVLDTFKRKRRKGSVENAIRSAVARWTDRLSLEERHIDARPPPAIEPWENCIADRLITVLEEKLGRPLRFSWNALTQKVFGRDLQLLAALFQVAHEHGVEPRRSLKRGKGVRIPGSERWFASRLITRRGRNALASRPKNLPSA